MKKARNLYKAMRFPSSAYNAYSLNTGDNKPVVTWTDESRVVFLVRADVMTEVDVDVLASAFNMDKTTFLGRVIEVDKFDDAGKVQAVIADEAFFQIYDNIFRFDEFYNARTMSWNEYLHVWETFAICPFANAVILATEAPAVKYTEISYGTDDTISVVQGGSKSKTIGVTPPNANASITYAVTTSEDGADPTDIVLTKSNHDRTIAIAPKADAVAGDYTITASTSGASGTLSDTLTLTVTASS